MIKKISFLLLILFSSLGIFSFGETLIGVPFQENPFQRQLSEQELLLEKSEILFKTQPKEALKIVEDVLVYTFESLNKDSKLRTKLNQNQKNDFLKLQAKAYFLLGAFNQNKSLNELALKNYLEAKTIYTESLNIEVPLFWEIAIARAYKLEKRFKESLDLFDSTIKNIPVNYDPKKRISIKNQMAELYYILGDGTKAENLHKEALALALENNLTREIIESNSLLGALSEKREEQEKAIKFYEKAQEIANTLGNKDLINREYSNLVRVYKTRNEGEALNTIQNAIEFNSKNKNLKALSGNQIELAQEFNKLNKIHKAISSLKSGIEYSKRTKSLEEWSKGLLELSNLYEKNGNSKLALETYRAYHVVKDSIQQKIFREKEEVETFSEELKLVQSKLEFLEDDKALDKRTIELLKQEDLLNRALIEQKNRTTLYLSLGLLFLLIIALSFIKLNQSRKRANKLLELKSLRTQMNPHFIFNSLNSVNNFISKSDERAANRYIADFSKLLRRVLEYSQDDLITLDLEFEIIELYLKLEHTRFKDKFDYTIELDSDVDLQMVKIPPMLLQPFIENSIWHGLRYKDEKGELKITLDEKESCYEIKISDNGIGREKSAELKTKNQKSHKSMALVNINARLDFIRTLFRTKLSVEINDGPNGKGTLVIVKVIK